MEFQPFSAAYIRSNQIMGWGEKAIEIRSVETGHLDGVFMHKRAQRLKFLCERNDKVESGSSLKLNSTNLSPAPREGGVCVKNHRDITGSCVCPPQVFFASVRSGGSSQVYFMTLGRSNLLSW